MHKYEIKGDRSLVNDNLTLKIEEGGYRIFHDYELSFGDDSDEIADTEFDVRIEFHNSKLTSFLEQVTVKGYTLYRFNDSVQEEDSVRYLVPVELADIIEEHDGLYVADDLPLEISKNTRIGLVDRNTVHKRFAGTLKNYYTPFYVEDLNSIVFEERYQSADYRVIDKAHLALCSMIMSDGVRMSQVVYK